MRKYFRFLPVLIVLFVVSVALRVHALWVSLS